jgi:hypothetical protein
MWLQLGPRVGSWQGGASHGGFEVTISRAWIEQWLPMMASFYGMRTHAMLGGCQHPTLGSLRLREHSGGHGEWVLTRRAKS